MTADSEDGRRTVLLTGVTGFLGKVVLEELMRRRLELGIHKVTVLIRPTKEAGKISSRSGSNTPPRPLTTAREDEHRHGSRFHDEVASSPCFSRLAPGWTQHVQPVYGDLEQPLLGLSDAVYAQLCAETTHIIHCAACVQFDLPLADALRINVQGTLVMRALARACPRLQHAVFTSTAYVAPHGGGSGGGRKPEALVPLGGPWVSAPELLAAFASRRVGEAEILRLTGHANTYTLTKCVAEHLLLQEGDDEDDGGAALPLTIVRPSIISVAVEFPRPGWCDSMSALTGFVLADQQGVLSVVEGDPNTTVDIVPVDFVSTTLISEALQPPTSGPRIVYAVAGLRGITTSAISAWVASYFQRADVRWLDYRHSRVAWLERGLRQRLPYALCRALCWARGYSDGVKQLARASDGFDRLDAVFGYFTLHTFEFTSSRPPSLQRTPCYQPRAYMRTVFRGTQQYFMRRARDRGPASTEKLIAGRDFRGGAKNAMKLILTSRAGWVVRLTALVAEWAFARMFQKVTFDEKSFHDALTSYDDAPRDNDNAAWGDDEWRLLILPSHRSYADFVLMAYLFYHFPGLGVRIPRIAAQDEFSRLPLLGPLLSRCLGAFWVRRGLGQPDPMLDDTVRHMVDEDEHILFFPEGQRSRTRQFLPPKRGLLRSIQKTGHPFQVLPVAISYERVPEEAAFLREAEEGRRPPMTVRGLLAWLWELMRGRVRLGRVHIKCGQLLHLNPATDVHALTDEVMDELQANTVVTTYHLQSFVHQHRRNLLAHEAQGSAPYPDHTPLLADPDAAVKLLRAELEERGATVLDGCLSVDEQQTMSPALASSLRNQWMPFIHRAGLHSCPRDIAFGRKALAAM